MGANQWRNEDDWPLRRVRQERYFLAFKGQSKFSERRRHPLIRGSAIRNHRIITSMTRRIRRPLSAVPCAVTPNICSPDRAISGRWKRVRMFWSTRPRSSPQDLEVTGPVTVELFASSSAVDTDFTAKLVDVWPDGFAQNLTEGIIRARYRDSQEKSTFLNPGQTYKLHLDLWSTSNVFRKGHQLRLEISSSNFPRFDRNLNTGENAAVRSKICSGYEHHLSRYRASLGTGLARRAQPVICAESGSRERPTGAPQSEIMS